MENITKRTPQLKTFIANRNKKKTEAFLSNKN